jgi:hypothetical protein
MDRYLFLDIEGVLITEQHRAITFPNQQDDYGELFDPLAVSNLGRVLDETKAKIIILTSGEEYGIDYLNEMWWFRNLPSRIFSMTPSLLSSKYYDPVTGEELVQTERYAKGQEIYAWFKTHGGLGLPYCIVDDEDGFFISQAPHLVKTDSKTGITNEIADKIIELLNTATHKKY